MHMEGRLNGIYNYREMTIPYKKVLLEQRKQKDPGIVPSFMLAWGGPGISHGYGFGEWMAEKFLGVESKLIYLCDKSTERKNENLTYSFEVETYA